MNKEILKIQPAQVEKQTEKSNVEICARTSAQNTAGVGSRIGRFFAVAAVMAIVVSGSFIGCQQNSAVEDETVDFSTYLSLTRSDIDITDWDNWSKVDKKSFLMAEIRMNITYDKEGFCKTKWTSNSQVNISEELFAWFTEQILFTNQVTELLNQKSSENWTPLRLKSGNTEPRYFNCVVQCLMHCLTCFGSSYSAPAIDEWVYNSGYYDSSQLGAVTGPVLAHFLSGYAVHENVLRYKTQSYYANGSGTKYVLVISKAGYVDHAVIFNKYINDNRVEYYDPQNGCYSHCKMTEVTTVAMITGIRYNYAYYYGW
jgi:hypothetical protein